MKKIITVLALLLVGGVLFSRAWAEDYPLRVAGIQVTSSNASNITGSGISGKVSYNSSTKTLTLNNTTINTSEACIYNYGIDNLTVCIKNNAELTSTSSHGIHSTRGITITSDDFSNVFITANTSNKCAVWVRNGNSLWIEKCWMVVEGYFALTGDGEEKLYLSRCYVYATSTGSAPCVNDFNEIGTFGVTYTYDGSTYNTTKKRLLDSSGNYLKSHYLRPRLAVGRNIWDPRYDASFNSSSSGINITSGSIDYVASTSTLTLNNVNVEIYNTDRDVISYYGLSSGNTLNVKLSGSNNVTLKDADAGYGGIDVGSNMKISGQSPSSSRLIINGTSVGMGIYVNGNKTLTLENVHVGSAYLRGRSEATAKLNINNCSVASTNSVCYFESCTMTGCDSRWSHFNKSEKGFCGRDGNLLESGVSILPVSTTYPIYILGRQMNDVNNESGMFSAEGMKGGWIDYDINTNMLTLSDVNLTTPSGSSEPILRNQKSGLNINLKGTNTLHTDGTGLLIDAYTQITGADDFSGVLKVEGSPTKGISFASEQLYLHDNAVVEVKGSSCGVGTTGNNSTAAGALTMGNATLRVRSGGVKGLKGINVSSSAVITTPRGGRAEQTSSNGRAIVDSDGNVAPYVQITTSDDPDFVFINGGGSEPADVNADGTVDNADITAVIKVIKERLESNSF